MVGSYDLPLASLREEIQQFSPRSVPILDIMRDRVSPQAAYFAAFILVCIYAEHELHKDLPRARLTAADLREFTFFEIAKDDLIALNLFDRLLDAFQAEPLP